MNFSNKRVMVLVAALLVCTLAVMGLSVTRMLKPKKSIKNGDNLVIAYFAAKRIAPRSPIEADMIQKRLIPQSQYFSGQATNDIVVVGKVSKTTIIAGEPILLEKLDDARAFSGLSFSIPEGKRAVSIRVNELSGFAGLIQPGDRVDVVLTYTVGGLKKSTVILQNEEILAIDQTVKNSSEVLQLLKTKPKDDRSSHVVTFALPLTEAQNLILAGQQGDLTLVLRSFRDVDVNEEKLPTSEVVNVITKGGSELAATIPDGTRAIAVEFTGPSSVLAQLLAPGDFVDVLYTRTDKTTNISRTVQLLQNKQIYGVDQDTYSKSSSSISVPETPGFVADEVKSASSKAGASGTVILTFALTGVEAQKVALAQQDGLLTLTLRPSGDQSPGYSGSTSQSDLMNSGAKGLDGVTILRKGK